MSYARHTSTVVVDPALAFSAGEVVGCATCGHSMKAPAAGHGLRCAHCRAIIYPCPLPTAPVRGLSPVPIAPMVQFIDPVVLQDARIQANKICPLFTLLERDGVSASILRPQDVGLRTLCRLRLVSRGMKMHANRALREVPPVVLLGGQKQKYSGANIDDVKALDLGNMAYINQPTLPTQRSGHCATVLHDQRIVVLGGSEHCWQHDKENSETESATAPRKTPRRKYKTESATALLCTNGLWSSLPSMNQKRHGARACTLRDGRVLVVGGSSGECFLNTCEILDLQTGVWTAGPKMQALYCQFALGLLNDGRVIAAGGCRSGQQGTQFRKCEIFDPDKNAWSDIADMLHQRAFCAGGVLHDGRFIVSGGEDERGPSASCETYNPATGIWNNIGHMHTARANHTICRAGPDLLALGGRPRGARSVERKVYEIELFDSVSNKWIKRANDPESMLVHHDIAAVNCRPMGTPVVVLRPSAASTASTASTATASGSKTPRTGGQGSGSSSTSNAKKGKGKRSAGSPTSTVNRNSTPAVAGLDLLADSSAEQQHKTQKAHSFDPNARRSSRKRKGLAALKYE